MATRNIVPRATGEGSIGTASKKWSDMRAVSATLDTINSSGTATVGTVTTGGLSATAATTTTFVAGTASVAPINLTAGINLSAAVAGAVEYDGKAFYATPNTSNRAIVPVTLFSSNVADVTLANSSSDQNWLVSTNDVLSFAATTTYEFEGMITVTGMGATTRTTALAFTTSSAFTSIYYEATIATGAANTISTVFNSFTSVASTDSILNATVTTAAMTIKFKGLIRTNAAGTLTPQIKFSADPTGTILCKKDSYIKLSPLGVNTVLAVGNWA